MVDYIIYLLIVGAYLSIRDHIRARRMKVYSEKGSAVEGIILAGRHVGSHRTLKDLNYTLWKISYTVNGVEYRITQRGKELDEETIEGYIGERVTVYYNPQKPKRAYSTLPDPTPNWYGMYGEKYD